VPLDHTALVRLVRSVVHGGTAITAGSTPSQLGVEILQHLRRDLADGHLAERRLDLLPGVGLVPLPGVLLDLVHPQPRIQCHAQSRGLVGGLRQPAGYGLHRLRLGWASSTSLAVLDDGATRSRRNCAWCRPSSTRLAAQLTLPGRAWSAEHAILEVDGPTL